MAANDVVGELSYDLVAQPLVQPLGVQVEGGHAHEDIGRDLQYPPFGKFYQCGAESLPSTQRINADRLDIADEGPSLGLRCRHEPGAGPGVVLGLER